MFRVPGFIDALFELCITLYEGFEKITYGTVSSACNRRRHWPECLGRVNRTFCFTGVSYRAQLLRAINA